MSNDASNDGVASGADEDVKARFREALERKGHQSQGGQGSGHRPDSAHGETDTHAHGGKREFRRKSG